MMSFGQLLREARKKARRTLREVSAATSLSISNISDMEHGRKKAPTEETIRKIENFLEIATGNLLRAAQNDSDASTEVKELISKRPPVLNLGLLRLTEGMSDEEVAAFILDLEKKKGKNSD